MTVKAWRDKLLFGLLIIVHY